MKKIVGFFAGEHLIVNVLTAVLIILGAASLFIIKKEIFPPVDFDITVVQTVMPGASPEQIENLITNPLEEALKEVDGIKKVQSIATENLSLITVFLDPDARNGDKTNRDIQLAIERINTLPQEAEDPIVTSIDSAQTPVLEVFISGNLPELEIRKAAKYIADELSLIKEVARITRKGYEKKEFLVEIDPEQMAFRRVPLRKVITALSLRNAATPGGRFKDPSGEELLVKTDAEYKTKDNILNTYIISNDEGYGTQVKDIATVTERQAEANILYRTNGKTSINLLVAKKSQADVLQLVEKTKQRLEELKKNLPDGIEVGVARDLSIYLKNRLSILKSNVYIGLFLVLCFLSFLLPFRVALVVAVGIPLAMLTTLLAAYFMGISINLITLMGLIIVLGMLVDDAIVVSENIYRHIEKEGKSWTSIVSGTTEVMGPVTASVLTTAFAFAPMLFMTGIFGKFIFQIPAIVIMALVFSWLEAFYIMPSHFGSWVKTSTKKKPSNHFDKITNIYRKYVKFSTHNKYKTLAIFILFIGITGFIGTQIKFVLFPSRDIEQFFIRAESPKNISLEQMQHYMKPLEESVATLSNSELLDYLTMVGIVQNDPNDPLTKRGPNYGQIFVELTAAKNRKRKAQEIIDELRQKIGSPPGLTQVNFEILKGGPPQGRPISIDVRGDNYDELRSVAYTLQDKLAAIEGIKDIQNSYVEGKDEWIIIPRHNDTARFGLTAQDIGTTVRTSFDGVIATRTRAFDEEIDVRVKLKEVLGGGETRLRELKVGNSLGHLIPLKSFADFEKRSTLSSVIHNKYKRVVNVSANVDTDIITSSEAIGLLKPEFEALTENNPKISIGLGGENEDTQESLTSLSRASVIAITLIYVLLIITFRSLLQPFIIICTMPMGVMGVIYALGLHGMPFSFMSILGIVALLGVIVNNSIVYLDFVNSLRKKGITRFQSLEDAAAIRFRPILLTTITTLCGLLPTAYGDFILKTFKIGGADPFVIPMALALAWGLGIGAILNSLFFPTMVAIMDDIYKLFGMQTFKEE